MDLEEAINDKRQAVAVTPPDRPNLTLILHNLGNSLRDRFQK